jgi:CRP-like cAMP-binding protein
VVAAPAEQIRTYLLRLANPPADELDAFVGRGRRTMLAKGEALIGIGGVEHRLAFLHAGIIRYHVTHPDTGSDVTKDFSFAPSLACSFASAVREQPARVAISAVEDCVVTLWPLAVWRGQLASHVEWERLGRRLAEALYARKEDRELSFLTQRADERFDAMLAMYPPEIARIPQHLIASYLGITPESLSRLRRRRRDIKPSG